MKTENLNSFNSYLSNEPTFIVIGAQEFKIYQFFGVNQLMSLYGHESRDMTSGSHGGDLKRCWVVGVVTWDVT